MESKICPEPHASAPPDPVVFRMEEIKSVREELTRMKDNRYNLTKKYKKVVNALDGAISGLGTVSAATNAAGLGLALSVVMAPMAIPFGAVGVCTGILSLMFIAPSKYYSKKLTKHTKIMTAIQTQLTAMITRVSRIIDDGKITDQEFGDLMTDKQKLYDHIAIIKREKVVYEVNEGELTEKLKRRIISNIK